MENFSSSSKNKPPELNTDEVKFIAQAQLGQEESDTELPDYVKTDIERGFKEIQTLLSSFYPYNYDNHEYLINVTSEEMAKIHLNLSEALESGFEGRSLRVIKKNPRYLILSSMIDGQEGIKTYRKTLELSVVSFREFIMNEVKVQFPSEVAAELNMKEIFRDLMPSRETLSNIKKNSDKAIDLLNRSIMQQISDGGVIPEGANSIDLARLDKSGHLYKVAAKIFMENKIDNSYDEIRIGDFQLQLIGSPVTEIRSSTGEFFGRGFRAINFGINNEDLKLNQGSILNVEGSVLHLVKLKREEKIKSKISITNGKKTIFVNHDLAMREMIGIKKVLV